MKKIKSTSGARNTKFRKVFVILLAAVLIYTAASVAASAIIFKVLFPRSDGTLPYVISYSEIDKSSYPRREVSFRSGNADLAGYIYDAKEPAGLVVVVNGIGGGADSHLPEIVYFLDHGWSAATYDATGVGKSGGDGVVGLSQGIKDLESFLDFLEGDERTSKLPIVLYGHSAGGYAAAASVDYSERVRCAVCISAFNSTSETMLHHAREKVSVLADIQYPFMLLQNYITFGEYANIKAFDKVSSSETPVALVSCSSDDTVPYEIGLAKYEGKFENPNVVCVSITDEWRNEHSTPWLSSRAAEYIASLNTENAVDKERANELDGDFMSFVVGFFRDSLYK